MKRKCDRVREANLVYQYLLAFIKKLAIIEYIEKTSLHFKPIEVQVPTIFIFKLLHFYYYYYIVTNYDYIDAIFNYLIPCTIFGWSIGLCILCGNGKRRRKSTNRKLTKTIYQDNLSKCFFFLTVL